MDIDRRSWLVTLGVGGLTAAAGRRAAAEDAVCPPADQPLLLQDFRPRSMLHVKETRVPTPRFPVVDVHTHFSFARGGRTGAAPEDAVAFNSTAKDASR
jgi:hypothetical protein